MRQCPSCGAAIGGGLATPPPGALPPIATPMGGYPAVQQPYGQPYGQPMQHLAQAAGGGRSALPWILLVIFVILGIVGIGVAVLVFAR